VRTNPFPPTSRQSVVTLTLWVAVCCLLSTSPGEITSKNGTLPDWLATCSNRAASTLCTRPRRVCPWTRRSFLRRSCPTCQMYVALLSFLRTVPSDQPVRQCTHTRARVWRKTGARGALLPFAFCAGRRRSSVREPGLCCGWRCIWHCGLAHSPSGSGGHHDHGGEAGDQGPATLIITGALPALVLLYSNGGG
jgi:hypothetical protein